MNRTFILILGLILVFSNSCSFDSKTGIWDGDEEEEIRIANLEKEQSKTISRTKIYSSKEIFAEEIALKSQIFLSKPKNNASWQMSGSNYQNLLGNIYLPSSENNFLKKKNWKK